MWVGGPHSSITHILLTLYPFYQRQGGDLFSPPRLGFCLLLLAILTFFLRLVRLTLLEAYTHGIIMSAQYIVSLVLKS